MDLENTGNDWMNEAHLLSAIDRKNPFTVPENYFNQLNADIISRCRIEEARFSDQDEFAVPTGYFESLSSEIESRITEEAIRSLAAGDGFTVPADYFSELKERIMAKAKTETSLKAVDTVVKPLRSNWVKYAAAASVTVVLGTVLLLNSQNNSIDSQLGRIPDQEIINYLQAHSDMGDTPIIMENLSQNVNLSDIDMDISESELEEYINTTL
jgi:hypothetical protein